VRGSAASPGGLTGSRDEAVEVQQTTLLRICREIDRFAGRSSLSTWIYRIVVNPCRDRQRASAVGGRALARLDRD